MAKTGCTCDPQMKKMWGCDEPSSQVVWRDIEDNDYYTCPINLISDNVLSWYDEYRFYQEFSGGIEYHKIPSKWIEARNMYSSYYNRYIEDQNSIKNKDSTTPLKNTIRMRKAKR